MPSRARRRRFNFRLRSLLLIGACVALIWCSSSLDKGWQRQLATLALFLSVIGGLAWIIIRAQSTGHRNDTSRADDWVAPNDHGDSGSR
jgi:hypothetical protein